MDAFILILDYKVPIYGYPKTLYDFVIVVNLSFPCLVFPLCGGASFL